MSTKRVLAGLAAAGALIATASAPAFADPQPITSSGSVRLAGADRYATAVTISQRSFTSPQPVVFIASGENYPDALAGGPVAAASGAPILLVGRTKLPGAVSNELKRLKPSQVYVLGGTGAVSDSVVRSIDGITGRVDRISGRDRYATAQALAAGFGQFDVAYVASGEGFADALAGGAAAAAEGGPLLLTAKSSLPGATKAALRAGKPSEVVILGGTGAVSGAVQSQIASALPGVHIFRYAGSDRYDTAAQLAVDLWGTTGARAAVYASGSSFPDALAGTPMAAINDAPVLLTRNSCRPYETTVATEELAPSLKVFVGGSSVSYAGGTTCGPAPAYPFPTDLDCSDFSSRAAAQAWFAYWYPKAGDIYRLDGDDDGLVCEAYRG